VLRVESLMPAVTLSFGTYGLMSVSSAAVLTGGGGTELPAQPPSFRAARVAVYPSWTVETGVLTVRRSSTSGRRDEVMGDASLRAPGLMS